MKSECSYHIPCFQWSTRKKSTYIHWTENTHNSWFHYLEYWYWQRSNLMFDFLLWKVRISYIVVMVKDSETSWGFIIWTCTFSYRLCFKVQFSVLRKPFDQLIQMGKMVCSTDSLISYPLEGSLKLPNSISPAHTLEICLFKRTHLNAKQQ